MTLGNVWLHKELLRPIKKRKPSHKELAILYNQFAVMLHGGVPFRTIMRTLVSSSLEPLKEIMFFVYKKIEEGATLSGAMANFSHIFSDFDTGIIHAGEQAGSLEQSMKRLAAHYEKIAHIYAQIKQIVMYPLFVLFSTLISMIVIFLYFIPSFKKTYEDMHLELPPITKIIFICVSWVTSPTGIIICLCLAIITIVYSRNFFNTPEGIKFRDWVFINCPGLNKITRNQILTEFFRTFTALMDSGLMLVRALQIQKLSTINSIMREHLEKVQIEIVAGKAGLIQIAEHDLFPPATQQVFATIQETGEYSKVLNKLADMYEVELNTSMEQFVQILTPLLFLIIGVFVGVILVSIMLPIYSMLEYFAR